MREEIAKQIAEHKGKITSFKYWLVALLDAAFVGGLQSIAGSAGLEFTGVAEMSAKTFGILFLCGVLSGVARFWIRNPLKDTLEDY